VSVLLVPDEQYDGREAELRTAGLAVHRAEGPWSATEPGSMSLVERHTARG
jgi:phosphohistidine phosphatase